MKMINQNIDPYYKKTILYKNGNIELNFLVSQELFSSQIIDNGTQRLQRSLMFEKINKFHKALDLGCGYGPIGIYLKKICPSAEVHMVDRDALALAFAAENAIHNSVSENVKVYGTLGYDSVNDSDFDLIVSNIPAKVGELMLTHMLKDARLHLVKNGKVVIVVIDAIADFIHQVLTEDESITITYHHSWPGHHVYHYTFKSIPMVNQNSLQTTTDQLRELDYVSYDTNLLLSKLASIKTNIANALIMRPGQGHIPVALVHKFRLDDIILVDRDLQALKVTQKNLISNGFKESNISLFHQIGINPGQTQVDALIGIIPEQQNLKYYESIIDQSTHLLNKNGFGMFCSSSTVIARLESLLTKSVPLKITTKDKQKGRCILTFQKK
jgi:16S rRNA G1207 methylase RsmC